MQVLDHRTLLDQISRERSCYREAGAHAHCAGSRAPGDLLPAAHLSSRCALHTHHLSPNPLHDGCNACIITAGGGSAVAAGS